MQPGLLHWERTMAVFYFTILALLTLQFYGWTAHAQSACPDDYVYTQQPPADIVCSPYIDRTLRLECSVLGPSVRRVQWYFSPADDESTNLLSNSSKYTLTPVAIQNGAGVRLTVNNLTEEMDSGSYWCQAYVVDSSFILSESIVFELRETSFYFPLTCRGRILRNSETRCATVMEAPTLELVTTAYSSIVSTPSSSVQPSLSSIFSAQDSASPNLLPAVISTTILPQVSDGLSPSILLNLTPIPTSIVTQLPVLSHTTMVHEPTNPSPTDLSTASIPTELSTAITFPNSIQSSDIILYAVLGLVGFLILICVSLAVVILILCRKRCQKVGLEGSELKEAGFDHLSNQKDLLHSRLSFKRRAAHTPYHPDISMQVSSSSQSRNGSGDYAEIGPALVTLRSNYNGTLNTTHDYSEIPEIPPGVRNPRVHHMPVSGETLQAGSETNEILTEGVDSENPYDLPVLPSLSPDNIMETTEDMGVKMDVELSPEPHDYHVLEKPPIDFDSSEDTTLSESSLSTISPNPPTSPHSYHILEGPPNDAQYLYHSHKEEGVCQLQTIPEHPYHVLEESPTSLSHVNPLECDPSTFRSSATLKEATPAFTDPEIDEKTCEPNDQRSDLKDREYDRLVGPQHLYQLLEKSTSTLRPRICEYLVSGYPNDQLDGQAFHPLPSHAPRHFLSPQTEESTVSSKSESFSDSSFEITFDDPQYTFSPRRRPINVKAKSDVGGHYRGVYRTQAADLTKYLGDYERDPSYMEILRKRSTDQKGVFKFPGHINEFTYSPPLVTREPVRRSSLPDLPHIYQALESTTKDPLQQYAKLRKQILTRKETAI